MFQIKTKSMNSTVYKIRCASIILMSTGYGWAGGHYIPVNSSILAYSFQFVIITFLLVLGLRFFTLPEYEKIKINRTINGLSIFSALSLVVNILNIIHGFFNPETNSFGSHNSFADLVPILIIIAGTGSWLLTLIHSKKET